MEPSLTTIDIPRRFMGQTAVDQLIRQMEDPGRHTVKLQISTSLIKRFSVLTATVSAFSYQFIQNSYVKFM